MRERDIQAGHNRPRHWAIQERITMINNWDEVQAIADLTFIIQDETGFGLALSASIAERLWKEGYRKVEEEE